MCVYNDNKDMKKKQGKIEAFHFIKIRNQRLTCFISESDFKMNKDVLKYAIS